MSFTITLLLHPIYAQAYPSTFIRAIIPTRPPLIVTVPDPLFHGVAEQLAPTHRTRSIPASTKQPGIRAMNNGKYIESTDGARLGVLALDGRGVRGLSSLMVL
jgi:hypothetical protein